MNGHFKTTCGRNFSFFTSFFRKVVKYGKKKNELTYGHTLAWALLDLEKKQYSVCSLVDKDTPNILLETLEEREILTDERLKRALKEMLEKGAVPYPDQLFEKDVIVAMDELDLNYDDNILKTLESGKYQIKLNNREKNISCDFTFTLEKPVIRHGDNGVLFGAEGADMFYYFIPRCKLKGVLSVDDQLLQIEEGSAWYDHEFGVQPTKEDEIKSTDICWNWLSVQLDNGCEISAFGFYNDDKEGSSLGRWVVVIDASGREKVYRDFNFEPLNTWTSTRTFYDYPTKWKLEIPEADIHLNVEGYIDRQEFLTLISNPAFWEGRIDAIGSWNGIRVKGPGFIERKGFHPSRDLDAFFKIVSRETLRSVRKILPNNPTREEASQLISHKDNLHYLDGLDISKYSKSVIQPIREIIDRGGKAWRSYAAVACCDAVGGNSDKARDWLALPEMLHVGALIVDDVEDNSAIRRGGPSCHEIYGQAIAINAGTASYFLSQICIYGQDVSDQKKLQIYNLFFECLRAAHAGQALDIEGLSYMMPEIIESGEGNLLEKRILAIHRLKSAVPVGILAEMSVIMGDGTELQIKGLKNYFESIGIAFQIIDDTLNLKGFKGGLKSKGEDISEGKVTFPIAKAMSMLPYDKRNQLWQKVSSKPKSRKIIAEVIDSLEEHGVLAACEKQAADITESAWKYLDPVIRDSFVKLMLRAFGWYVLERSY